VNSVDQTVEFLTKKMCVSQEEQEALAEAYLDLKEEIMLLRYGN